MTTAPPAPPVFARRYRALSTGITGLVMLIAFEALAVATVMPVIGRELHGYHLYGLAFSGNLAASVIAMVLGGRWSDARGPTGPLWTGVVAFIGGLAGAGLASGMEALLVSRFLQGLGAGLFTVALYVLVAQAYPAALHPRVFSLLAAAWVVPSVVGPALAGLVAERWSWRWVFLGVAVLAVPAALVLWRSLPAAQPVRREPMGRAFLPRLAWGVLAAVGAALLQYGGGQQGGFPLAAAGLAMLGSALPRLVPAGTLRAARGLPTVIALRGLVAGAFSGAEVFVALTLTQQRHLGTAQAGLALTGAALAWSLGSWIQGRWPRRRLRTLRAGTALIAVGIMVTALTVPGRLPVLVAFAGWAIAGLGIGLVFPTLSVLVLELSAPGEEGRDSASLSIGEAALSVAAVGVTGALFAGLGGTALAYLVCFALLAVLAVAAALLCPRFAHRHRPGTMKV